MHDERARWEVCAQAGPHRVGTWADVSNSTATEEIVEETEPREHRDWLGRPGRRFDRNSPFVIAVTATFGVAVAYGVVRGVVLASEVLSLIAVALVIGIGLDPAVRFLTRRGLSRPWAVVVITVAFIAVVGGFVAAAVPPISHEITALSKAIPRYRSDLVAGRGGIGHVVSRLHLNNYFRSNRKGTSGLISFDVVGGVLGAGKAALSVVGALLVIMVLTVYFLAALPRIEATGLRLVPASRRERARTL